ncbi:MULTISPECIES: OmpH family outer membrane protein [Nonlabens]|uniref:Outer membrane protein H n=2 Tax=Nonlabens ulvanivorans TaxID=906888 RepID=A0A081DEY0_NONUL|nr:OmpH family outer membrane protein [Nonlabens ulvanivorans]GAK77476.1 outer membrane protein H precursor [Nonlabens ulvanivorans]GAL74910.1 outer membrane protein H precursor [Nonlabens ulvanivorans]
MKNIISLVAILIIAASCQETQKVVFIDNAKVYEEYQEKIDLEASITKRQEDFKKRTDSLAMAYQMEAAPLQAKFNNLSQQQQQTNPEIVAFGKKWQMIESQIKTQEQSMQEQLENDLKELDTHVEEFIAAHAKKNNYAFVLGKNKSGGLIYGNESSNITETVIKEINASYKGKNSSTETSSETEEVTKEVTEE